MQVRIIVPDHLQVALEYRMIGNVKAYQCSEQAYVGFGQMRPEEEGSFALGEDVFDPVEGFEQRDDVLVIRFLCRCKPGLIEQSFYARDFRTLVIYTDLVDSVVDVVVHPFV